MSQQLDQLLSEIQNLESSQDEVKTQFTTKVITIRMSVAQHKLIKEAAHHARLSMNRFVLSVALKEVVKFLQTRVHEPSSVEISDQQTKSE